MHLNFQPIKEHPVATFAIVLVGALVVYMLFFRRPSTANAGVATGQTTNTDQLQALQMQGNFALAGAQIQADTSKHVSDLAATVQTHQTDSTLAAILASLQEKQAETSLQLDAQKNSNTTAVSLAKIGADAANYGAQLSYAATTNAQDISYNEQQIAADTQRQQDQLRYSLDFNALSAQTGLQNKQLDTINNLIAANVNKAPSASATG